MLKPFQPRTVAIIQRETGMSMDEIRQTPIEECDRRIEKRMGHRLTFGVEPGHVPRGNALIQLGRIIWPDKVES